jgi:DNA-binding CsgD family transcriptional regulator
MFSKQPNKLQFMTLGASLDKAPLEQKFILPGLIPEAANVFVRVAPDVEALEFATQLAYSIAGGLNFLPFGKAEPVITSAFFRAHHARRVQEHFQMFVEKQQSEAGRQRAQENLHYYADELGGNQAGYLNWASTQGLLDESLPDGCKLLIHFDARRAIAQKRADPMDHRSIANHLRKLNSDGIAVVIFYQGSKRGNDTLEDELLSDGSNYFLELSYDSGAPHEFGGGFNVHRRKMSEFDTIPSCYQHWYRIVDRKIDFGWEIRDQNDKATAKQLEIHERQMRVQQLLAEGMEQKEIASVLKVDPATVCRDVSKIKVDGKSKPAADDVFDDQFE